MFAARITDAVAHPGPNVLSGGPGSLDVKIGGKPAWRAVPAALGAALEAASDVIMALLDAPSLNPVAVELAMPGVNAAFDAGVQNSDNPAAATATAGALEALNIGTDALNTAWTSASAAPGGQPGADEAYTEGVQALLATAAAAAFAAMALGLDIHACTCGPIPHGPGVVTSASKSVSVNGLPLARQGDQVTEAAGGANPIMMGYPKVSVG